MKEPNRPQASWLVRVFTLDLRSLAVARVGIGLLLLANLYQRVWDAEAHYSDIGALPRVARWHLSAVGEWTGPAAWTSLHMLSGDTWFQIALMAGAVVPAVCVLIGYRTQLALLVSWILLVGLQGRNPLVLNGGDDLFRCLIWWTLFVPMGAVWSLDSWRSSSARSANVVSVCSPGTAAIILQLCSMYWFTAILKSDPMWRGEFTAIYYALSTDHFTTPCGYALLAFPELLRAGTLATILLEFIGPILLFWPVSTDFIRGVVAGVFILFHVGLAVTMKLGLFPAICIVYWLILLPTAFWEMALCIRSPGFRRAAVADAIGRDSRPTPAIGTWPGFASNCLVLLLLAYVFGINVARLHGGIHANLKPGPLRTLGEAAQLNQYWCMFSPRPYDFGGWLALNGTLADGTRVNLLHHDLYPYDWKPDLVSATYPNQRWRKYLLNLIERDEPLHRECLCDYLRRQWDRCHDSSQRVVAVEFVNVAEITELPEGHTLLHETCERRVLYRWQVGGDLLVDKSL